MKLSEYTETNMLPRQRSLPRGTCLIVERPSGATCGRPSVAGRLCKTHQMRYLRGAPPMSAPIRPRARRP